MTSHASSSAHRSINHPYQYMPTYKPRWQHHNPTFLNCSTDRHQPYWQVSTSIPADFSYSQVLAHRGWHFNTPKSNTYIRILRFAASTKTMLSATHSDVIFDFQQFPDGTPIMPCACQLQLFETHETEISACCTFPLRALPLIAATLIRLHRSYEIMAKVCLICDGPDTNPMLFDYEIWSISASLSTT